MKKIYDNAKQYRDVYRTLNPVYGQKPNILNQLQFEDKILDNKINPNILSDENIPEKEMNKLDFKNDIEKVLSILTPRESKVLKMRFGIDMNGGNAKDTDGYSLEEVGKQFDVTQERIRQIEAKALRKLRNPVMASVIKDYLEVA